MNFSEKIYYDFIKNRNKFFLFSLILVVVGIASLFIVKLNFGVDFSAGTNMDIATQKATNKEEVDQIMSKFNFDYIATVGGTNDERVTIRFKEVLAQADTNAINSAFNEKLGTDVSSEVNIVSPDMARELGIKTIWAILIASLGIMLYVMLRFEWRIALAANLSILYDGFVVVALFSIFRLEVDLPLIAAVLTTIGYSINDKIVIFDRVRENMRFSKSKKPDQLALIINRSIWQTMARNIYTVLTVFIVALAIYLFGSESIKLFSLAILIGLVSGAYSSICLASPLWYVFKKNQKEKKPVKSQTAL
ncbi:MULTISPECIES: protein translocase subunit SecF [unclassified Paenibacillus]|uniref:protein translocase subunit SecF n=1 Tax=unclassified Paenibacillus TaxID=185978 RepID=UPI002F403657